MLRVSFSSRAPFAGAMTMYAKPILQPVNLKVEHCMCCTVTARGSPSNPHPLNEELEVRTALCPFPIQAEPIVVETAIGSLVIAG